MSLFFKNANEVPAEALPGTRKKSFALFYAGGEIWCEHLDGMYGHTEAVIEKFKADLPSIAKPSSPSHVVVDLDETIVTPAMIELIADSFTENAHFLQKLVFVGLDRAARKQFQKAFRQKDSLVTFAVNYIDDFEKAKEWLISDRY